MEASTRGSNILDILYQIGPPLIESCSVTAGISDHEIVLTKFLVQVKLAMFPCSKTDLSVVQS